MDPSKALERQVHRIHELMEGSNSEVKWDDHIPDPDTCPRLRQVDISIRRDNTLTVIECRKTRRRQDVQWIEELFGRRRSCGADAIFAVAQEGFTSSARRKAARFGVLLRELRPLSEEEVAIWGGQVKLVLYYYQYSDVNLAIGFPPLTVSKLDPAVLSRELRSHNILQSAFNATARQLDSRKLLAADDSRNYRFRVLLRPEMLKLCGEPVLEIGLAGKARLVAQPIRSPGVLGYGEPADAATQREAEVEQFELGETNIVHDDDRIAIHVDLSELALPPLSQFRYVRVASEREMDHASLAITNPEKLGVTGPLSVDLYELCA